MEPVFAAKPSPEVSADSAILIDAKTGEILYSKDINKKEYPASTTKIMTALLALERLELNEIVTVDDKSPFTKGSKIALNEGEELSVEELLYALLVPSANDAAEALAVRMSGSLDEFAKLMNSRAKELGAKNTNFVNPSGLENDAHMTTAYDLAMIAREAMKNEDFRRFVSTYTYTMAPTNKQPQERLMHNTNRLLYDGQHTVVYEGKTRPIKYDGVTGIKTGYTSQAGYPLVSGAKRDNIELIAVTMHSVSDNARYLDAISLLEYGFANYKTVLAISGGISAGALAIQTGLVDSVGAVVSEDVWVTVPAEADAADIENDIQLESFLEAPVSAGDTAGIMSIKYQGVELAQVKLLVSENVSRGAVTATVGLGRRIAGTILRVVLFLLALFVLVVFVYVMYKRRQIRLKRQRRAERAARMAQESNVMDEMRRLRSR
ncbi:hypothetical protein FACS1894127_1040 [Clostridia bacterium]|nr:hypothetical protein FACS1894127_1040 [Clostridia bacterium]